MKTLLGRSLEDLAHILGIESAILAQWATAISEAPEILGARRVVIEEACEELITVRNLLNLVAEKERALRGRNLANLLVAPRPFETPRDAGPDTLRILHELRTRAYGKAVLLRDSASGAPRILRVAQANYGFPKLGILNRQSSVSRQLVSIERGDELTIGPNSYQVLGVAHLERFTTNELADNYNNFSRMDLEHDELRESAVVLDLARSLRHELEYLFSGQPEPQPIEEDSREIQRGDTERLAAHFYVRTTHLQEALMQRPSEGLAAVLGVAGSGKTSVALGRTKVICDRTEDEGGDPTLFRTETAVGFVLSSQLTTYLQRACQHLYLLEMPILEYRELREQLLRARHLDTGDFEREISSSVQGLESTMAWLRAADIALAEEFAVSLRASVARPPEERESARKAVAQRTPEQQAALVAMWQTLASGIGEVADWLNAERDSPPFRLEGLAARVDSVRARFARELETHQAWTGAKNRELRQNVRNSLRERIVRTLRLPEAYGTALADHTFTRMLRRTLPQMHPEAIDHEVDAVLARLKARQLSDATVDVLLALGHVISVGYRGRADRDPISHLAEPSWYSQVFIDEFQDFSEVQVFLMGAQSDPRHRVVTIVGDFRQQLTSAMPLDLAACFPTASAEEIRPVILLENKRQTPRLARLSQRFREVILNDVPSIALDFAARGLPARLLEIDEQELTELLYEEIVQIPRNDSIVVICPSANIAAMLERSLRGKLGRQFRETRYSQHADLVRRFFVHFTTPLDTKGLEFDVAIVPHLEAYDLTDAVQANCLYVAISRPRKRLSLIGLRSAIDPRLRALLQEQRSDASP